MMDDEAPTRTAIAALIAELSNRGDAGDISALSRLFVDTGVYTLQDGRSATGPLAIERMLSSFSRQMSEKGAAAPRYMRHNVTTSYIELTSEHEAKGDTYFLNVNEKGLDHWGRWRDSYTRQGRRWLFASREVIVEGTSTNSWLNDQG